jgi:hypothetical protein
MDTMSDDRPLTLRRLAARVASHPRIAQAVTSAIQATLPMIVGDLLDELADTGGGTLRLYRRKRPKAKRVERDDRIRAMLAEGRPAPAISEAVKCSVSHVYNVRLQWRAAAGAPAGPDDDSKTPP